MNVQNDKRGSAFGGAILLMATMVLIALTAGMFFGDMSLSSKQTEMPEPEFRYDYTDSESSDDSLYIRHVEGARINPTQFAVNLTGASCTGSGNPNGQYSVQNDFGLNKDNWMSPGMALKIDDDNPTRMCKSGQFNLDGATVTLVWQSPEGNYKTIERWSP